MKKVSLVVAAIALTVGLSTAIGRTTPRISVYASTVYQYTDGGVVLITATRTTAQEAIGCSGGTCVCARAWSTNGSKIHVTMFDLFYECEK